MGYEVDFLRVGDKSRSGDAIAVRFGNLYGNRQEQFVMVIDGGTKDSGTELVEHIEKHYATKRIDLVVSTHPDADHASGLTEVLENAEVECLWMHQPWTHAAEIRDLFRSGRITDASLRENLRKALDKARELEEIANRRGIPIYEPFSDDTSLPFQGMGLRVLGPSTALYESLLPHFRETPQPKQASFLERVFTAAKEVVYNVSESRGFETLADPQDGATTAENSTSVILLVQCDDRKLLFTGDAGTLALGQAADFAESVGIDLPSLSFVQIPHHGSRHNVGPTVLNRILGQKGQDTNKMAFASCSEEAARYPSRRVTNAFQRRGARDQVFDTKGFEVLSHRRGAPGRAGLVAAVPVPFHSQVGRD